jgi:hypothetical protein
MPRLALHISLTALALVTGANSLGAGREPALRLRIAPLGQNRLSVRVMTASEVQKRARNPVEVVVEPPVVVSIADSIQSIRLVVIGFGSVRATLTDTEKPGRDEVVAEGRDLTLVRDARGRFYRAWTAQPLVP